MPHAVVSLVCRDCQGRQEPAAYASDEQLLQAVRAFLGQHRTCRFDVSFVVGAAGVPRPRQPTEQTDERHT